MQPIIVDDETLIDLYLGDDPLREIALQLEVSENWLATRIRRLRREGRLPPHRPRNLAKISEIKEDWPSASARASALLLERLREVHGEPRYDIPKGIARATGPGGIASRASRKRDVRARQTQAAAIKG